MEKENEGEDYEGDDFEERNLIEEYGEEVLENDAR